MNLIVWLPLLIVLIAALLLNVYVAVFADHQKGHWDGVKECKKWCFDPIQWVKTLGYHPQWLAQKEVQQLCDEAFSWNTPYTPTYCNFFKQS